MGSLFPPDPISSHLLELIADSPGMTVGELVTALERRYRAIPSKTVYRRVNRLLETQLLVRSERGLALNLVWVAELVTFAAAAEASYVRNLEQVVKFPQREGKTIEYGAGSLGALDPIWNNLLTALALEVEDRKWCGYNSHPWYTLATLDTERRLFEGLSRQGITIEMVYGGESFLDHFGARRLRVRGLARP